MSAGLTPRYPTTPPQGAIDEARSSPNGFVYQIDGDFRPDEYVPPERILGAWKVDGDGQIIGAFIPNPNYEPSE
jgi:hypothetical protein